MRKQGKYYGPKTPARAREPDTLDGSIHRLVVEKNVSGGAGLCRVDGQVVFVPESLLGEELTVVLGTANGGYREAHIITIEQKSPFRVEAPCPVYGECGGCDFQYASQAGQIELKRGVLVDALRRQGGFDIEKSDIELETFDGPAWAYRNRMQFHVGPIGPQGEPGPGLMARKSNQVVGLSACMVASPEIQTWLTEGKFGHGERTPVFGYQGKVWKNDEEITVELAGKKIGFSADGFFQSNLVMLEKLLVWITAHLDAINAGRPAHPKLTALDLYCGCGVFAANLPDAYNQVWAVDNSAVNCSFARKNTDPKRTHVFEGDVDWWLDTDVPPDLDLAIVDPPREGLSVKLRSWLVDATPRTIVYVSCNPVTFSRDLKQLLQGGYRIRSIAIFDFYPQTWHIETACVLEFVEA